MTAEPTTARGRATRDRIVSRVAAAVAEHGVRGASLEQLLAAAGASKSQFVHYFGGREQLMAAAVAYQCEQFLAGLTQAFASVRTLAELRRTIEGFVEQYERDPAGCPIGSMASDVAGHNEPARVHLSDAFAAWERLFEEAFTRIRAAGELRPDAPPDVLATALLASLEGGMLLSQVRRDGAALRIAVDSALGFVGTFAA